MNPRQKIKIARGILKQAEYLLEDGYFEIAQRRLKKANKILNSLAKEIMGENYEPT
ncbi:unnamed protein product [marine sediment metagenome]|uniref:ANTAR domain-containing protein n=1 Tax=marine sediment metagenome TaxID=412755 RepID=X1L9W6_9ZZZZ